MSHLPRPVNALSISFQCGHVSHTQREESPPVAFEDNAQPEDRFSFVIPNIQPICIGSLCVCVCVCMCMCVC